MFINLFCHEISFSKKGFFFVWHAVVASPDTVSTLLLLTLPLPFSLAPFLTIFDLDPKIFSLYQQVQIMFMWYYDSDWNSLSIDVLNIYIFLFLGTDFDHLKYGSFWGIFGIYFEFYIAEGIFCNKKNTFGERFRRIEVKSELKSF